mmetsp:Transcript_793/g.1911  ORF Transcript_793/g.1911 Transcript_793/m.1911 type:complete len:304 (+) Transcript_793:370-1281(+)
MLDPVVAVAVLVFDGGLVRPHQGRLVVQRRVVLHDELVDLRERHDVVPVVVDAAPQFPQLVVVCDDYLDLLFEVVKHLEVLPRHHVRMCGLGAVHRPHDLPAALSGDDVAVKVGVVIRVDALPDVGAELDKEHLAAVVAVDLFELVLRLLGAQVQAQRAEAPGELVHVDAAVVAGVDDLENLPQLVEPEDVQQQSAELLLFDPVVPVAVLEDRLLVGAHQGRLVVEDRVVIHHEFVDLRERDDIVAVVVDAVPERVELPVVQHERLDLFLELVEVRAALGLDDELTGGLVAGVHPQCLAALLA